MAVSVDSDQDKETAVGMSISLPLSLATKLQRYANETGKKRSVVVAEILSAYLDGSEEEAA